jgi:hypothetical protein
MLLTTVRVLVCMHVVGNSVWLLLSAIAVVNRAALSKFAPLTRNRRIKKLLTLN